MTTTDERRADGIRRVPVEALVEVCSVGGKQTPFEAESADVSGRGIRLRTAYLPESGSPVVCRFENSGREVIAEGVVAWCQKETRGGEFGVKFTALDARSADTLRELCGLSADSPNAPARPLSKDGASGQLVPSGAKVKLHIEGLGSPMRARVDEGKAGQISVGSSLEFLRIGRKLELESLEDGRRHEARIDGLDVAIDPSTGVPRLLVLLKTRGDEDTPQPSVVDTAQRSRDGAANARRSREEREVPHLGNGAKSERSEGAATKRHDVADSDDPTDEQIDAMVGRVRRIAGVTKRKVTDVTFQLGTRLGPSMVRAFQRVRQMSHRQAEPPRRRTTAAPTSTAPGSDRELRPQNRHVSSNAEASKSASTLLSPRVRKLGTSVVAAGLLATVIAVAMRNPEPIRLDTASTSPTKPDQVVVGNPAPLPAVPGAALPGNTSGANSALIAQVPLFGPTQMATLERVPPPAAAAAAEPAAAVAAREQAIAKAAQAAVAGGVGATKLSEEPSSESSEASEEPSAKPEDVAPFGHGRMKDPILYRIKLDAPGEALKGTSSSKGFTVVIPGRKALESPKGFVKRDDRFQKISSTDGPDGVKITWLFKDDAPPFRVRLRKSSVEFLISEDAKSPKAK